MRASQFLLATGLLFVRGYAAAQQETYPDVKLDRLAGPVRSVVTSRSQPSTDVRPPNGPSIVVPIMRDHCEYDSDGLRTLGETQQTGGPYGESMQIGRDAQGFVYDRRTLDLQSGRMVRYERFGPHGVVDDRRYGPDGKMTNEFIQSWDEKGHRSMFMAKDGDGNEVSRRRTTFTAEGVQTEVISWGANGSVEWSETYDPGTGVTQFRNYDAQGKLRLSSTDVHGRVAAFWASEDKLGGSSIGPTKGLHQDTSMCHADGTCDHLIYDYASEDNLNPKSVELRGPTGALKAGSYYNYVLDAHGNWTSRSVRLKVGDKALALYEEDTRTILYWPKQ